MSVISLFMESSPYSDRLRTQLQNAGHQFLSPDNNAIDLQTISAGPKSFVYDGKTSNLVVIDDDFPVTSRTGNNGLALFRDLRLAGYETPAVILTWHSAGTLQTMDFAENIFITAGYMGSCRILRLPVQWSDITKASGELRAITAQELNEGRSFRERAWLTHKLSGLGKQPKSHILKNLEEIIRTIPGSQTAKTLTELTRKELSEEELRAQIQAIIHQTARKL